MLIFFDRHQCLFWWDYLIEFFMKWYLMLLVVIFSCLYLSGDTQLWLGPSKSTMCCCCWSKTENMFIFMRELLWMCSDCVLTVWLCDYATVMIFLIYVCDSDRCKDIGFWLQGVANIAYSIYISVVNYWVNLVSG